jgi:phosphoglycolate phosphatase-like HAD superfamily hydrolase
MREAGVAPSETLLVGDSPVDMRTARAAGVRVCLARYGFGYLGFGVEKLAPVDCAIDQPADLLRVL